MYNFFEKVYNWTLFSLTYPVASFVLIDSKFNTNITYLKSRAMNILFKLQ